MAWLRRIQPLDLALGAVALVTVVYALVTIPGYRWHGTVDGGFTRRMPVSVTLEVTQPSLLALAATIAPGPFAAETSRGVVTVTVAAIDGGPESGAMRLHLELTADVDGRDRAFWSDYRLRPGEGFSIADRTRRVSGVLVAVEGVDATSP